MTTYAVAGYCLRTGKHIKIHVLASSSKHARTKAYKTLRHPRVLGHAKMKHKPGLA